MSTPTPPAEQALFGASVRQFAQERARRTYAALVDAALALFGEKGYDATQSPDIAARAGVSVGTFYRYFPDKRAVFIEVMQGHLAHAHQDVMSRVTADRLGRGDRRAAIQEALAALLENCTIRPGLQVVFLQMSLRDPEVARLRHRFDSESQRRLAELFAAVCPRDRVPDVDATAFVVHTAVVETALQIAGFRGPPPVSHDRALTALTDLVMRALFEDEPR